MPIHMKTFFTSKNLAQEIAGAKIAATGCSSHSVFILAVALAAVLQHRAASQDQLFLMLLITLERLFDHVERGVGGKNLLDLHLLALQLLVVLEKTAHYQQAVAGKVAGLKIFAEFGIVGGDRDDLVVGSAGVDHGHDADGAGLDQSQRLHRLLAKNE